MAAEESEGRQVTKFHLTLAGEVYTDELPELLERLGGIAVNHELRFGQQELDLEDFDMQRLQHMVGVQDCRMFYARHYNPKKPSPLATRLFNQIANTLPEESRMRDRKGNIVWAERAAWDREVWQILRGTGAIKIGFDSESWKYLSEFQNFLPSFEEQA